MRNPRAMKAQFMSGIFTALLSLCLYWKVGQYEGSYTDPIDYATLRRFEYNLNGFAFLIANNISF